MSCGTVVLWLALCPHSKKVPGFDFGSGYFCAEFACHPLKMFDITNDDKHETVEQMKSNFKQELITFFQNCSGWSPQFPNT